MKLTITMCVLLGLFLIPLLAVAQENVPETTGEALVSSKWLDKQGCFCVDPKRLAEAAFQIEYGRLKVDLFEKRSVEREKEILGNCELKVDAVQKWCGERVVMVTDAYKSQVTQVISQSNEMISTMGNSYGKRLEAVSDLIKPEVKRWYESPTLWAVVGMTVGTVAGVGIGAIVWK